MTTTATVTNGNPAMTLAMAGTPGRGLETNGVSSPRVFFLFFWYVLFFYLFFYSTNNYLQWRYLERHRRAPMPATT
jgi:hypothetical protein